MLKKSMNEKKNFGLKKDSVAIVSMLNFCFPAMLFSFFLVFFLHSSGSICFGTGVTYMSFSAEDTGFILLHEFY